MQLINRTLLSACIFCGLLVTMLTPWVVAAQGIETSRVVVSVKPIHSLVSSLLADMDAPQLLFRDGAALQHDLDLSQQQMLQHADLLIWVGPELEPSLAKLIPTLPASVRVITLLDNHKLKILPQRKEIITGVGAGARELAESEVGRDPYFWLDSRNVLILVDELTYLLVDADPLRTHLYSRNRQAIFNTLAKLDRELEYGYRGLQGSGTLLYHDQLYYFEQAYALKVLAVLEHSTAGVNSESLLAMRQIIAQQQAGCLLLDENFPAPYLDLLLGEVTPSTINLGYIDSLGTRFAAGSDLYLQMMRHNAGVIATCVRSKANTQAAVENESLAGTIGRQFMLLNQHGQLVTREEMLGSYQLIYFGYTGCPDVCPTTMQTMVQAQQRLGELASAVKLYFITVDPERDTVGRMAEYADYFGNAVTALTGTPAMIEQVARDYHIRYERLENASDNGNYQLDHTASTLLLSPTGDFIARIAYGVSAGDMAAVVKHYIEAERGR
ncbi:MAG: SCO family protein [Gammaproteobacteria bacterium]|nr:SCO family protein [Gammaproteobacteria bacterium]